jgi:hypothetical protein
MGRTVQFALALQMAALCLGGQPIGILFDFATPPDPLAVEAMRSEIVDILAPAALDLRFQGINEPASQAFRKIVIVRFRGACQASTNHLTFPDAVPDYPALGKTDVSGGRILPYIQVFCDEVRAFVPPAITTLPFRRVYGRALGRIVVHELYHALLNTRGHTKAGVARFAQTPRDLSRDKLPLDDASIEHLRRLYGPPELEIKMEGNSEELPSYAATVFLP